MSVDNSWQRGARNALDGALSLIAKWQIPTQVRMRYNNTTLRRLTFGDVLNKDELERSAQAGTLYRLVTERGTGKRIAKRVPVQELRLLLANKQYAAIMQLFRR